MLTAEEFISVESDFIASWLLAYNGHSNKGGLNKSLLAQWARIIEKELLHISEQIKEIPKSTSVKPFK